MAKESKFQAGLIKELKQRFPGSIVFKNDPNYIQGVPDLLILIMISGRPLSVSAAQVLPSSQTKNSIFLNLARCHMRSSFIQKTRRRYLMNFNKHLNLEGQHAFFRS